MDDFSTEQKVLNMLFKSKRPIALDNKNIASKLGLSIVEMNTAVGILCKKAELIFSDFSDLFDPKQYYKMDHFYFCLSGGGMSAEIIEPLLREELENLMAQKNE